MLNYRTISILSAICIQIFACNTANACTDFVVNTEDAKFIVGRSMEWGLDLQSQVWQYPRNQSRSSTSPAGAKGLSWSSKYGYLGLDSNNLPIALDGLNEQGLSIGLLWLPGTIYQEVNESKPESALNLMDLGHWLLGNFASVAEVKSEISKVKIWAPEIKDWGGKPTAHIAIHDSQGHSAVIEFINGEQKFYDNPNGVLTNAPTFDWHVVNLRNYLRVSAGNAAPLKIEGTVLAPPGQGGGFLGIPGDWTPPSRFVRTTAMLQFAKKVKDSGSGVTLAQHILNAVDIPLGDVRQQSNDLEHSDYTQWIVIKDLSNKVLYFRSYDNLTLHAIDLKKLNLQKGQEPVRLTPVAIDDPIVDITDKVTTH